MPTTKRGPSAGSVPNVTAEFFTLAGIAAAVASTAGVGEKAYRLMKTQEPLVVQILDSVALTYEHRVILKATNQTLHGIYLESFELSLPEGLTPEFYLKESVPSSGLELSSDGWVHHKAGDCFPKHIAPGSETSFTFSFPLLERPHKPFGSCRLHFSRLEEQKPDKKDIAFRIRW